jgi:outer membrane protein OmpA-like peptidoglycan-associated protein
MRSLRKYNLFLYAIDARKKNKVSANFKVYDPSKEVVASGRTDALRDQMTVALTEKTNYTIEITAAGYKPYEGKITPDSSMKNTPIASWLVKDDSKFTFRVLDEKTRKIVEKCTAKLTDVKSSQELSLSKNGDEYSADLSPVASYMLEIEAVGYAKYVSRIEPNSDRKRDVQLLRIKEPVVARPSILSASITNPKEKLSNSSSKSFEKIEKGKAIVLNNVYFEQSSFIMQKESYPELDKVVSMLKSNPQTKIEIGGHTDNVGDNRLNLALSENRAKVILNYLVSKGIDEDRLLYKGYGGTKPVAPNDSEDNKKKNRRVEIVGIQ